MGTTGKSRHFFRTILSSKSTSSVKPELASWLDWLSTLAPLAGKAFSSIPRNLAALPALFSQALFLLLFSRCLVYSLEHYYNISLADLLESTELAFGIFSNGTTNISYLLRL
ncbi:MAG: hypothetical protein ACK5CA_17025 [Cyanobacteriota bacterium]